MPIRTQEIPPPKRKQKNLRLRVQKPRRPTEKEIQRAVIKRLQLEKWLVVRVNSGSRKGDAGNFFRAYIIEGLFGDKGRPVCSGFPDLVAFKGDVPGGRFLLLEIKDHVGELSPAQQRFHEYADGFGIHVYTVRHPDELRAILEKELP